MWALYLLLQAAVAGEDIESLNKTLRIDAAHGRIGRIEKLIKQGAQINGKSEYGESALYYAVLFGQIKTSLWLLSHGADPNIEDDVGRTPLLKAAEDCNDRVVDTLLRSGARVNHSDQWGKTALMNAVDSNCIRTVAILLTRARGKIKIGAQDHGLMRAEDFVKGPMVQRMLDLAKEGQTDLVPSVLH